MPEFTDIHISNVVCRGTKTAIKAKGIEGMNCIHDIEIANSTIVYTSKGADIDETTAKVKLSNVNIVEDKAQ